MEKRNFSPGTLKEVSFQAPSLTPNGVGVSLPKRYPPRRIPPGTIHGSIPLDAAKSFPTMLFPEDPKRIRIAYSDISNNEKVELYIKTLPGGAKTSPHPQIVLYTRGDYHVETLDYSSSNPYAWTTWQEHHINALNIDRLITALFRAKIELEALQ